MLGRLIPILTILQLSPAFATEAIQPAPYTYNASKCARLMNSLLNTLTDYEPRDVFTFTDQASNHTFTLHARRISNGMTGEVYEVDRWPGLKLPELPPEQKWVVKLPLRLKEKFGGRAFFHSRIFQKEEADLYRQLADNISNIESSSHYPKNPAWESGHLPIVPLEASVRTEKGWILFKPYMKGMDIKAIYKKFGADLPAEMKSQLGDVYQLAQAAYEKLRSMDLPSSIIRAWQNIR